MMRWTPSLPGSSVQNIIIGKKGCQIRLLRRSRSQGLEMTLKHALNRTKHLGRPISLQDLLDLLKCGLCPREPILSGDSPIGVPIGDQREDPCLARRLHMKESRDKLEQRGELVIDVHLPLVVWRPAHVNRLELAL